MEMIEKDPPYMGMPPTRVLFNILKKGLPDLKVFFFFFFFYSYFLFFLFFSFLSFFLSFFLSPLSLHFTHHPSQNPDASSPDLKDFIAQCTQREPHDRPTCAELLNHPFITRSCDKNELIQLVEVAKEEKENDYLDDDEDEEDDYY